MCWTAGFDRLAAVVFVAGLIAAGLVIGMVAASPQPVPLCSVCGQTFHENVTGTTATLEISETGDVNWRVENELAEPTASEWRENPEAAEGTFQEALDSGVRVPVRPEDSSIEMRGDTVVIEFVDPGAARGHLGLLVVPYFHGETSVYRWVVNADELVVIAPDGYRIVNAPAGATVEGDRAVWRGAIGGSATRDVASAAPEPGDTYVVAGTGATAGVRATILTPLLPLDPVLYGLYAVGLLFVTGLAFGIYTIQGHRLGPRRVSAALMVVAFPYLLFVVAFHPPKLAGLAGFAGLITGIVLVLTLGIIGGAALYGAAATGSRVGPE